MTNGNACRNGHQYTTKSTAMKLNPNGRYYRECKICRQNQSEDRAKGPLSKWAKTQKAIHYGTVTRQPMLECWSCTPSTVTGIRGRVILDEDGDPWCMTCDRVQHVIVKLAQ